MDFEDIDIYSSLTDKELISYAEDIEADSYLCSPECLEQYLY